VPTLSDTTIGTNKAHKTTFEALFVVNIQSGQKIYLLDHT